MAIDDLEARLANAHHGGTRAGRELSSDELMEVARRDDPRIAGRAMDELVRRGDERALPLLVDRASDRRRPLAQRATDVARLGRLGSPAAEPLVLSLLAKAKEPLVRVKALGALARIGTEAALPALAADTSSDHPALQRMASFAQAVVGHRLGKSKLRRPKASRGVGFELERAVNPIASTPVDIGTIPDILQDIAGDAFGVRPTTARGLELTCPAGRWMLVVDGAVLGGGGALLAKRPAIVGVLVKYFEEDRSWSTSRVILAGPTEEGVYVDVYRQDGLLVHSGLGTLAANRIDVRIGSVAAPGNFALDLRVHGFGDDLGVAGFASRAKAERGRPIPRKPPGETPPDKKADARRPVRKRR